MNIIPYVLPPSLLYSLLGHEYGIPQYLLLWMAVTIVVVGGDGESEGIFTNLQSYIFCFENCISDGLYSSMLGKLEEVTRKSCDCHMTTSHIATRYVATKRLLTVFRISTSQPLLDCGGEKERERDTKYMHAHSLL